MKSRVGLKQSYIFFLLILSCNVLLAPAQTRRTGAKQGTQAAAGPSKAKTQSCSDAWTGVINYTRTQTNSNNKTVQRVSGRGEDTTDMAKMVSPIIRIHRRVSIRPVCRNSAERAYHATHGRGSNSGTSSSSFARAAVQLF
jgi:hypothetical protein